MHLIETTSGFPWHGKTVQFACDHFLQIHFEHVSHISIECQLIDFRIKERPHRHSQIPAPTVGDQQLRGWVQLDVLAHAVFVGELNGCLEQEVHVPGVVLVFPLLHVKEVGAVAALELA